MILHDLLNEVSLSFVCEKYCMSRGLVQTLQLNACNFAGMASISCAMHAEISEKGIDLGFGILRQVEMASLGITNSSISMPIVGGNTARIGRTRPIAYDEGVSCSGAL
jgi:hypothetical protein